MNALRNMLCMLAILIIFAITFVNSELFRNYTKGILEQKLSEATNSRISIGSLDSWLPYTLNLSDVRVQVGGNFRAEAQKIQVKTALFSLIYGDFPKCNFDIENMIISHPELSQSFSSVTAELSIEENKYLFIKNCHANDTALSLITDLTIELGDDPFEFNANGKIHHLSWTPPKFPSSIQARGSVQFSYIDDLDQQTIQFTLALLKIKSPNLFPGTLFPNAQCRRFNLSGAFSAPFNELHGQMTLTSSDIVFQDFQFSEFQAELSSKDQSEEWFYKAYAANDKEPLLSFSIAGSMSPFDLQPSLVVESCNVKGFKHNFTLKNPFKSLLIKNDLIIPTTHILVDEQELSFNGQCAFDHIDLKFSYNAQPFEYPLALPLNPGLPASAISGSLTIDGSLYGPPLNPNGKLNAIIENLKYNAPFAKRLPPIRVDLSASLERNKLAIDATYRNQNVQWLKLQSHLLVNRKGIFPTGIPSDQAISANLSGGGEIPSAIYDFISPTISLRGKSEFSLDITGTLDQPKTNGKAKFVNGALEILETGAILRNINVDLTATNQQISITSIKATDLEGGTVNGTGFITLDSSLLFPFQAKLNLNKIHPVKLDNIQASLSGKVQLQGNRQEATLTGELTTDQINITLPEQLSQNYQSLNVIYINQPLHEPHPSRQIASSGDWPLHLDLHLSAPGKIFIYDEDLSSEWKGDVKINGTPLSPLIYGDLRIRNGEYFISGKKFKIEKGTVSFSGDPLKKTNLYIVGALEVSDIIAEVILKGSLDDPSISFRSKPPLSQREILSRVLFGVGDSLDIAHSEGVKEKMDGYVEGNKKAKDSNNDKISLRFGRYIHRNVFVGITTAKTNRIGIEANLRKNLKVQAEIGDDTRKQVRLKWKHDY